MKTQVSGSLSLDMSGLAEGLADLLHPQIQQVQVTLDVIRSLITAPALSDAELVRAIHLALITSSGQDHPTFQPQAAYLAEHLTRSGYALVRVGQTPEETGQIPVPTTVAAPGEPTFWDDGSRD